MPSSSVARRAANLTLPCGIRPPQDSRDSRQPLLGDQGQQLAGGALVAALPLAHLILGDVEIQGKHALADLLALAQGANFRTGVKQD